MVIAKTTSRNVAFKTNVMSQAVVLEAQSSFVTSEVTDQDASSQRCSARSMTVMLCATLTYTFLIMKSIMVNLSLD